MSLIWEQRSPDGTTQSEDSVTKLRLVIEPVRNGYEFNGHKFATEDEAKAFAAEYCASSTLWHGLSADKPARNKP